MAHGLNSAKTPSRPSYPALEKHSEDVIDGARTPEEKLDNAAMRGAQRAQHRIQDNQENIPGSTIFSK